MAPDAAFPRQPQGLRATLFQHPLDSLRPEEISAAVQAIRERYGCGMACASKLVPILSLSSHPTPRPTHCTPIAQPSCPYPTPPMSSQAPPLRRKDLRNSTSVRFIEVGLLEPHPSLIPLLPEPGQALPPRPMPVERRARALTYDTGEWV